MILDGVARQGAIHLHLELYVVDVYNLLRARPYEQVAIRLVAAARHLDAASELELKILLLRTVGTINI